MTRTPAPLLLAAVLAAVLAAATLGARDALAQSQQPAPRIAASSFATTEVHVNSRPIGSRWYDEDAGLTGPARIAISYSQPHARGRKVLGGLIPLDTVWRFGANAATTLHTDVDLTLGTLKVPRGDYSLFMLYSAGGTQLIVNRATGQWGTDRDASKDIGRVPLVSRTLAEPEESLSIYLVPESARPAAGFAELRGVLRIKWGTTELSAPWTVSSDSRPQSVDWPAYGNDAGGLKYSPLADVNRDNVTKLAIAFSWEAKEQPIPASEGQKPARPGQFQATPLAIHDTLFFSTPFNRVIALDARDGRELWAFDPQPWKTYGQPSNGTGFVHRGVATWTDGRERRVFINSRWRLIALDAATGMRISAFGTNGEVDVTQNLSRPVRREHYTNTSPPVVWGNVVILGNGVGDRLVYHGDPPGDIQAFDVKTGKRIWRFKTVPEPGEFGNDTWKNDSWKYMGHTNAWAPFTVDSARGYVYLPVGTPSDDWYGGERKGAGLFGETILCLDARTGKRVWHFQTAHHGLWDYDPPAPPVLATVMHDGRKVDIVAAPTKQGFLFVFDRVTGKPLWPIEERAVPQSDVPGEESWPTQPFPTKPAPFARQGFTLDDVVDFTPEIKQAAIAELSKYRLGPMYTPPSLQGSLVLPGDIGGSGWGGAAVDPETGWLYVKATNSPVLMMIEKHDNPSDTVDTPYMNNLGRGRVSLRIGDAPGNAAGDRGNSLPIIKPPYGTLTAIDLNTGDTKWQVPLGDTPEVRNHPALKGVALPEKLGVSGSPGALVTKGGLVFSTGGGRVLYAIDSKSGKTLWEYDLGQVAYANPMTYRTREGKQVVVIATGGGTTSKLVAFALP